MNQAVKSHWKLAWRSFTKAVSVTFQTIFAMLRSRRYSFKVEDDLQKSRSELKVMLDIKEHKEDMIGFNLIGK